MKYGIFIICLYFIPTYTLKSQCSPPMAETCDEAFAICSLSELNGYSCNNPSSVPSSCSPLCSNGGVGHNTSWWAFVCNGGEVSITLTIGSCTNGQGLQFGIWGDCTCGEDIVCSSIPCVPPGSVQVINAHLKACKTYYLWVDGCSGDVCDFTINTPPGGPPVLPELGTINNLKRKDTIDVCIGACQVPFYVNENAYGCFPTYVWTCHGMQVGGNERKILLDFPIEGDFEICVSASIGNTKNGSICQKSGPECIWVRARKATDRIGSLRTLCWEQVYVDGYKWHDQNITGSGIYRQLIIDSNCCKFDSIVEFKVLDKPIVEDVFHISFRNNPFVDATGKAHDPCVEKMLVKMPAGTILNQCDSSINLTSVNIDPDVRWQGRCNDGKVELIPEIIFYNLCHLGESIQLSYNWYLKNDPFRRTINDKSSLIIDAVNESYCVEIKYNVTIGNLTKDWTVVYCESIQEDSFINTTQELFLSACDSLLYKGIWYTVSDTLNLPIDTVSTCEHKIRVHLNILKSSSTDLLITSCDSAFINGISYTQSGNFTQRLKNRNLCDSILNLDLEINKSYHNKYSISSCDSIIVGNERYFATGNYIQKLQTWHGCDSLIDLELIISKSSRTDTMMEICDSLMINGMVYRESGQYINYLKSHSGCDSLLYLDLTVRPGNNGTLHAGNDLTVCQGDSIGLRAEFSGNAKYLWRSSHGYFSSVDQLTSLYLATSPGANQVYLEASDDCNYWIDSLTILVHPKTQIQILGDPFIHACTESIFTAVGGLNYHWTPANIVECLDRTCSKVLLTKYNESTVLTADANEPCTIPASINLVMEQTTSDIYVPNVFSPNGDQINDIFLPVITIDRIHNYSLNIYDRWGTLLFETSDLNSGWNGVYRQTHMEPAVYSYLIQYYTCDHKRIIKSGDLTLVR